MHAIATLFLAAALTTAAPVPKTVAEVLVGKWKCILLFNGQPLESLDAEIDFRDKGVVETAQTHKRGHRVVRKGEYEITGKTVTMKFVIEGETEIRQFTIEMSDSDTITTATDGTGPTASRLILKRLK